MKARNLVRILLLLACLCVGGINVSRGQDGLFHWSYRNSNSFNRVRFTGGLFFALGDYGLLMTSTDGSNWTQRTTGTTASLKGVAYGRIFSGFNIVNCYIVVSSSGAILTSTDNAVSWTLSYVGVGLNDITYTGFEFVAAATRVASSDPNILYSYNAGSWIPVTFPGTGHAGGYVCSAICYDPDDDVLVTAGGTQFAYDVWTSYDDGDTWTNTVFSNEYVTGIAYGNGRFIIVGFEGFPCISTNGGQSWFFDTDYTDVDPFFHPPGLPDVGSDIAFGNGEFVVSDANSYESLLMTSSSGTNWGRFSPVPYINLYSIAYGNGRFVGVSKSQYNTFPAGIYQSMPVNLVVITSTPLFNTNALRLTISGEVGLEYRLQSSINFSNWSTLWTYTNTNGTVQYTAPINTNYSQLYFRVISP